MSEPHGKTKALLSLAENCAHPGRLLITSRSTALSRPIRIGDRLIARSFPRHHGIADHQDNRRPPLGVRRIQAENRGGTERGSTHTHTLAHSRREKYRI